MQEQPKVFKVKKDPAQGRSASSYNLQADTLDYLREGSAVTYIKGESLDKSNRSSITTLKSTTGQRAVVRTYNLAPNSKILVMLKTSVAALKHLGLLIATKIVKFTPEQIAAKHRKLVEPQDEPGMWQTGGTAEPKGTGFTNGDTAKYYLFRDFIPGKDLHDYVMHNPLSELELVRIMLALIDAVLDLHKQNVLHRDIKLDNAVITFDPVSKVPKVKLVDYEFAVYCPNKLVFLEPELRGTEDYIHPNIITALKSADIAAAEYNAATDIYALSMALLILGSRCAGVNEFIEPVQQACLQNLDAATSALTDARASLNELLVGIDDGDDDSSSFDATNYMVSAFDIQTAAAAAAPANDQPAAASNILKGPGSH